MFREGTIGKQGAHHDNIMMSTSKQGTSQSSGDNVTITPKRAERGQAKPKLRPALPPRTGRQDVLRPADRLATKESRDR
jgi:hypothetical protein